MWLSWGANVDEPVWFSTTFLLTTHTSSLPPRIPPLGWVVKQSVGTTPVITGKALKTTYHMTEQYIEIDIDVSANSVAAYVTGLVRGATKSLVIDMGECALCSSCTVTVPPTFPHIQCLHL